MRSMALMAAAGLASITMATDFPVDEGSTSSVQGLTSIALEGTLIGDWDSEGNPEGTNTIPGLWGGSGNNAIPVEMGPSIALDFAGDISGSMSIDIDSAPGACVMQYVDWDLLGSGDASADVILSIQYETFRSEQPSSLFIGGFPVDIPVGASQITEARFQQIGPGVGLSLERSDQPGVFDIDAAVAGLLHVTMDLLGTPTPLQFPVAGVIEGTYAIDDDGETVNLTALFEVNETSDEPGVALPTIPMELPTILPPGDLAGVLLDLTPQGMAVQTKIHMAITGHVNNDAMPGDATGDGLVNTDDILAVLSQWGQCKACDADLNGDGLVGVNDILIIIDYWT